MKPDTIHALDRLFGPPLSLLLTGYRCIADLFAARDANREPEPPKKILFLKMVEQGATVLAEPAIREAVRRVGRENVYFWVFKENRPILDILDLLPPENIITVDAGSLRTFVPSVLANLRRIHDLRIDTVIDMEFFSRASAILAALSGARIRVGLHRYTMEAPYRGNLFTHRMQYNPHLHIAPYYLLLIQAAFTPPPHDEPLLKELPLPSALAMPVFTPAADETARVRALIEKELGAPLGKPFVLLNPNASDIVPLRKWPVENFELLTRSILKRWPDAVIGLTGGRAESAKAEEMAARLGSTRIVSLAGKTTLRELLAAYALADLLVTNDSGPGHFSSMVPSMDSLVLFGPETPALWGPLGPASHTLASGLACSPCVNPFNHRFSACRNPRCMQTLTADRVWQEVEAILQHRQG